MDSPIVRRGATPAQVALTWLLAQKPWIAPIPGTTKLTQLEENIGAAAVELSGDDLREIEDAKFTVQGVRYPEELMQLSGLSDTGRMRRCRRPHIRPDFAKSSGIRSFRLRGPRHC